MKVHGFEITAEIEAAAVRYMKVRVFQACHLERYLVTLGVPEVGQDERDYIAHRAADRLIQKHRKSMTFTKKNWHWNL